MLNLRTLRCDLAASVVVFLVALPLSMGIALASGVPLAAGLVAAAVGGIVAGALGGAPLLVSGPAAGLAVMAFDLNSRFGLATLGLITVATGVLQLGLGWARVARLATGITPAVLHGMLAGIGILLAVAQLHVVFGSTPLSSVWRNLQALPAAGLAANPQAAALGALTMTALLVWPKVPLLRRSGVPPALAAVLGATVVAALFHLDVPRVQIAADVLHLQLPSWPAQNLAGVVGAILTMTLVASAESLLSAVAVDKLHSGRRANLDRELVGQGMANVISGMLGGLPVTGVIVRSTANIEAGARTRLATICHGVWVVVAVTALSRWLNTVPLAALAGLLIVVGLRLVNLRELRDLHRHGESVVYYVTVAGVVCINLLVGIAAGVALAVLRLLWQLTRTRLKVEQGDGRHRIAVQGAATFLLVPELTRLFAAVAPGDLVSIELDSTVVDHAASEALAGFSRSHAATGGRVQVEARRRRRGTQQQPARLSG